LNLFEINYCSKVEEELDIPNFGNMYFDFTTYNFRKAKEYPISSLIKRATKIDLIYCHIVLIQIPTSSRSSA